MIIIKKKTRVSVHSMNHSVYNNIVRNRRKNKIEMKTMAVTAVDARASSVIYLYNALYGQSDARVYVSVYSIYIYTRICFAGDKTRPRGFVRRKTTRFKRTLPRTACVIL